MKVQAILFFSVLILLPSCKDDNEVLLTSYLTCPDNNHPHPIDLGLPSGTKWACCNVGATDPEDYGGYFAWGEIEEKDYYDESTYKYCNDNGEFFNHIGNDIAGSKYDVAHMKWGGEWCMPTDYQQRELRENCSCKWTIQKGVDGLLIVGSNGGTIFLPAAGDRLCDYFNNKGVSGSYLSSSLNPNDENFAYHLWFDTNKQSWKFSYGYSIRYKGVTVRAISK